MNEYQQRKARSLATYKPSLWAMKVDVDKVNKTIFGKKARPSREDSLNLPDTILPLCKGGTLTATVIVVPSKSTGHGQRGLRLWIECPMCKQRVSMGRVHQHYGYKHPVAGPVKNP